MERYTYVSTISAGAYGVVYECIDSKTGQLVAAKGIRLAHQDAEVLRLTLREVTILKLLPPHPNVVKLLEAFRSKSGRVYLIFEFVERSLYQELERHPNGALPGPMVKSVAWQLLHALKHCHDHNVVHRDLKPANVLLSGYTPGIGGGGVAKLCDFGFARLVGSRAQLNGGRGRSVGGSGGGNDFGRDNDWDGNSSTAMEVAMARYDKFRGDVVQMSSYVMTRWYRPPEVLVGDSYGTSIDIWSLGCTLAELATGRPLFPGQSTADQLWLIMRCLGPLTRPHMTRLLLDGSLASLTTAPPARSRSLRQRLPEACPELLDLISNCLMLDPRQRPTADELLQMPYFSDVPRLFAGTDLAKQLPYTADMVCTIKGGPAAAAASVAAADAAKGSTSGSCGGAGSRHGCGNGGGGGSGNNGQRVSQGSGAKSQVQQVAEQALEPVNQANENNNSMRTRTLRMAAAAAALTVASGPNVLQVARLPLPPSPDGTGVLAKPAVAFLPDHTAASVAIPSYETAARCGGGDVGGVGIGNVEGSGHDRDQAVEERSTIDVSIMTRPSGASLAAEARTGAPEAEARALAGCRSLPAEEISRSMTITAAEARKDEAEATAAATVATAAAAAQVSSASVVVSLTGMLNAVPVVHDCTAACSESATLQLLPPPSPSSLVLVPRLPQQAPPPPLLSSLVPPVRPDAATARTAFLHSIQDETVDVAALAMASEAAGGGGVAIPTVATDRLGLGPASLAVGAVSTELPAHATYRIMEMPFLPATAAAAAGPTAAAAAAAAPNAASSSLAAAAAATAAPVRITKTDAAVATQELSGIVGGAFGLSSEHVAWDPQLRTGESGWTPTHGGGGGGGGAMLPCTSTAPDGVGAGADAARAAVAVPLDIRMNHDCGGGGDGSCGGSNLAMYGSVNGLDSCDGRPASLRMRPFGIVQPLRMLAERVRRYVRGSHDSCSEGGAGAGVGGVAHQLCFGSTASGLGVGSNLSHMNEAPASPSCDLPCVRSPTGVPAMPTDGSAAFLAMPHVRRRAPMLHRCSRSIFRVQIAAKSAHYSPPGLPRTSSTTAAGLPLPYESSLIQGSLCHSTIAGGAGCTNGGGPVGGGGGGGFHTPTRSSTANAVQSTNLTPTRCSQPGLSIGESLRTSYTLRWFSRHSLDCGTMAFPTRMERRAAGVTAADSAAYSAGTREEAAAMASRAGQGVGPQACVFVAAAVAGGGGGGGGALQTTSRFSGPSGIRRITGGLTRALKLQPPPPSPPSPPAAVAQSHATPQRPICGALTASRSVTLAEIFHNQDSYDVDAAASASVAAAAVAIAATADGPLAKAAHRQSISGANSSHRTICGSGAGGASGSDVGSCGGFGREAQAYPLGTVGRDTSNCGVAAGPVGAVLPRAWQPQLLFQRQSDSGVQLTRVVPVSGLAAPPLYGTAAATVAAAAATTAATAAACSPTAAAATAAAAASSAAVGCSTSSAAAANAWSVQPAAGAGPHDAVHVLIPTPAPAASSAASGTSRSISMQNTPGFVPPTAAGRSRSRFSFSQSVSSAAPSAAPADADGLKGNGNGSSGGGGGGSGGSSMGPRGQPFRSGSSAVCNETLQCTGATSTCSICRAPSMTRGSQLTSGVVLDSAAAGAAAAAANYLLLLPPPPPPPPQQQQQPHPQPQYGGVWSAGFDSGRQSNLNGLLYGTISYSVPAVGTLSSVSTSFLASVAAPILEGDVEGEAAVVDQSGLVAEAAGAAAGQSTTAVTTAATAAAAAAAANVAASTAAAATATTSATTESKSGGQSHGIRFTEDPNGWNKASRHHHHNYDQGGAGRSAAASPGTAATPLATATGNAKERPEASTYTVHAVVSGSAVRSEHRAISAAGDASSSSSSSSSQASKAAAAVAPGTGTRPLRTSGGGGGGTTGSKGRRLRSVLCRLCFISGWGR